MKRYPRHYMRRGLIIIAHYRLGISEYPEALIDIIAINHSSYMDLVLPKSHTEHVTIASLKRNTEKEKHISYAPKQELHH